MDIERIKKLKESEDKVEFKEAQHNFSFTGSKHTNQKDRRKCYLGYVVALSNEGSGMLVLGMSDKESHDVVGTDFAQGQIGNLEDEVYKRLQIRVHINELFDENGLRVMITNIPSRPVGKLMKFEGVPLMRTGGSLRNMSDEEMLKILSEQEPDFSAKICETITIDDLDDGAIKILKEKYAEKQNNPAFFSLSHHHALTDLELIVNDKITYAALILLGKKDKIKELLPQCKIVIEYRRSETQIPSDNRVEIQEPLFVTIEKAWNYLNQPASNPTHKIHQGPYIFNVPYFNEQVIREAVLNALMHRDYNITSEVVIKQYPQKITITNPGGFPLGVTKENILTINSTPRSRLLADVLLKTGLVERSGQGVDKLYLLSLSDSKPEPDYSKSGLLQVELNILAKIRDPSFLIFIREEQNKRDENNKLGVFDVIVLDKIRQGVSGERFESHKESLNKLESEGLIVKIGKTSSLQYLLSSEYYDLVENKIKPEVHGYQSQYLLVISEYFENNNTAKMGDFVNLFIDKLNRGQVKYMIDKVVEDKVLNSEGSGRGTKYFLADTIDKEKEIFKQVINQLNEKD